ncbi:MAG: 16S rRNA (guanine(527)-N(7))-methyltransferase RsmG [Bacteroidota bacterium]|nr:16S rRNA (guanine(527)-N(7))-methyltransferase RsmG [Bacteroidota bacterium]
MNIILKYFPDLSTEKIEKLDALKDLYFYWNEKINVISRKDIDQLYERHVLHSLSIAKIIDFEPHTQILDVGTGGGFPGIPLAILFPKSRFHLIDATAKKLLVVEGVADTLDLENVTSEHIRAEDIEDKYDFIVSRAVTNLPKFYEWVKRKVSSDSFNKIDNGVLYIKGGDFKNELKQIRAKKSIYELSDMFEEEFFETKKIVHLARR